jgi:hypothetical protein
MRAALVIVTVRQQGQDGFVAEQINPESSPPELKDNQCDSGKIIAKSVSALNARLPGDACQAILELRAETQNPCDKVASASV